MAASPPRGWSRGGGRAPSRRSRPGALGVLASPLEGLAGEAAPEPARGGGCGRGDSGRERGRAVDWHRWLRRDPTLRGGGGPRMVDGSRRRPPP